MADHQHRTRPLKRKKKIQAGKHDSRIMSRNGGRVESHTQTSVRQKPIPGKKWITETQANTDAKLEAGVQSSKAIGTNFLVLSL
jgi:hypothetical protein